MKWLSPWLEGGSTQKRQLSLGEFGSLGHLCGRRNVLAYLEASTLALVCRTESPPDLRWLRIVTSPVTYEGRSLSWKPPGATRFCSRQAWGRQVAYSSQFLDRDNRAHRGKSKIKSRLIAGLDPDEWAFPPKPKWMRWSTYLRYEREFDRYESILDEGCAELMAKFLGYDSH